MNFLVFGDSIVYGLWDPRGGWVGRLRADLDQAVLESNFEKDFSVYNLGIPGNTSVNLLARFEPEIKVRLDENECAFVFGIGINDSQLLNQKKTHFVPPDLFLGNITEIILVARKYSSRIVFVGLTPVDESKMDPNPWKPEKSYKNEYIQKYNQILKDICREQKVDFVDILDSLKQAGFEKNLVDGLHPDSQGHQKIYEIVKEFLVDKGVLRT